MNNVEQGRAADQALLQEGAARYPMPEHEMERLEKRRWILDYLPKGGVGVEIGVFRGHFSALICEIVNPRKLYMIDPWTRIGTTFGWGKAYTAFGTLPTAHAREEARARTDLFPQVEIVMIEDYYPACASHIPEELDFAYLDSSHHYERTLVELEALSGQMAPEGMILGDDWKPNPNSPHHGVFRAVQDFILRGGWQIVAAGPHGQWALRRRS